MTLTSRYRPSATLTFQTSATTSETITIALRQVTNPAKVSLITNQLGLDDAALILEGRLTDPTLKPAALKAKHKAPLEWAGRDGLVTVEPYQGALTSRWAATFGEKLLLTWRSTV